MYFRFDCEHCGRSLKARDEDIGRRGKCPYCHCSFTVPQQAWQAPEQEPREEQALLDALERMKEKKPGQEEIEGERPLRPAATAASEGTNVNPLTSSLLGLLFTIAFYLVLVLPFYKFYFGELFLQRGWVPFAEVFLMCWAAAILVLKYRKVAKQREALLFDVLPNEVAQDVAPETVNKFVEHIRSLPTKPGESFLINRVLRALEHFSVRKSNPEVASLLSSQSDIDAAAVESSYSLLKVFVWAIPILGFIGTVIGISVAVGSFSGALERAQDLAVLKQSLGSVTGGLATAFDTTLIALVMSLLVMFPTSALQKAEEDLLTSIDEYCNENLLKRLKDGREPEAAVPAGDLAAQVRQAVNSALAAYQAELHAWNQKLEQIGETITDKVAQGWSKLFEQARKQHEQLAHTLETNAQRQAVTMERIDSLQAHVADMQAVQLDAIAKAAEAIQSHTQAAQAALRRCTEELRKTLAALVQDTEQMQNRLSGAVDQSAQSLNSCFSTLERGLSGLSSTLERLNENAKLALAAQSKQHRGWWPFGRISGDDSGT